MSEFLDNMRGSEMEILEIAREIRELAEAFRVTGNHVVGDRLLVLAFRLQKIEKVINASVAADLDKSVWNAERSSQAVLQAALAGAELAADKQG